MRMGLGQRNLGKHGVVLSLIEFNKPVLGNARTARANELCRAGEVQVKSLGKVVAFRILRPGTGKYTWAGIA